MREKAQILDYSGISRAVNRICYEIVERNKGTKDIVIIGILTGGKELANMIKNRLFVIEGEEIPVGYIDIAKNRDDKKTEPKGSTKVDFPVADKTVILVDDVMYTGRSARAAIDTVMEFGRPKLIQLAVLVDRGHRELPIRADYVGKNLPTSRGERVSVTLTETNGVVNILEED